MDMLYNPILAADSYKASHFSQYPADTKALFSYLGPRGGAYDKVVFFGLQYILDRYFSVPVTQAHIDEAEEVLLAHGEPFHREGWEIILREYGGKLPLAIAAVPEGSVLPNNVPWMTVESTDPCLAWLPSYMETVLLRVWYPTTVATRSWQVKQIISAYLEETSDDPAGQLPFKLHDFGARGVSSEESAGIGGLAHLVNFRGTDTLTALRFARQYYGEPMAGFSIPASEHSTITSWGREAELEAYRNMLAQFGGNGKIFACVVDSYNLEEAVASLWGQQLREAVIGSGSMVVLRPDSGDPVDMALRTAKLLDATFGSTINSKGYHVLNHVRIIYGDGINETTIRGICLNLKLHGFSIDNIAFGMGGYLLQMLNRDTLKVAMKTSAILRGDVWQDVYKDPVTDPGKRSHRGCISTYRNQYTGEVLVERIDVAQNRPELVNLMRLVWRNGDFLIRDSLQSIRQLAS